jgi:hypothetical protein
VSDDYLTAVRTVGDRSVLNQPDTTRTKRTRWRSEPRSLLPRRVITSRENIKPRWARNLDTPEDDVVIVLKPISEELGPTPETAVAMLRVAWEPLLANQSSLHYAPVDQTEKMHEVAGDLSSEMESTWLLVDVGERTATFGTRSLLPPATAAEDELDSMLTKINRVEHELWVTLETSAEGTHQKAQQGNWFGGTEKGEKTTEEHTQWRRWRGRGRVQQGLSTAKP